jgi:hypothetical protein
MVGRTGLAAGRSCSCVRAKGPIGRSHFNRTNTKVPTALKALKATLRHKAIKYRRVMIKLIFARFDGLRVPCSVDRISKVKISRAILDSEVSTLPTVRTG